MNTATQKTRYLIKHKLAEGLSEAIADIHFGSECVERGGKMNENGNLVITRWTIDQFTQKNEAGTGYSEKFANLCAVIHAKDLDGNPIPPFAINIPNMI